MKLKGKSETGSLRTR